MFGHTVISDVVTSGRGDSLAMPVGSLSQGTYFLSVLTAQYRMTTLRICRRFFPRREKVRRSVFLRPVTRRGGTEAVGNSTDRDAELGKFVTPILELPGA